jgi:hypothetical protein
VTDVQEPLPYGPATTDLLIWLAARPRRYAETLEVWHTHCPRLSVWEDAIADGLVEVVRTGSESSVTLTGRGRAAIDLSSRTAR